MATSDIKVIIQSDIDSVWENVLAVECYHTWRKDVDRIEVIDEKQFIEYTKNGYFTTFNTTVVEPHKRWELDIENSHIKGHWTFIFTSKDSETEINFTACVTAKKLFLRPIDKSVFEQTYLKKEQTQFVSDLNQHLT
ncbi:MAG: SRPBCC family protein [Lachnospiraceae bacterium]|nr:SRPBCC family protein [Lachnospiraceae bacterium]